MSHTVEDLVRIYVKMRDALSTRRKEFEAYEDEMKSKMSRVENELLARLNEQNVDSMKTESGTVYKQSKLKPSIRDFAALRTWILETGNVDILQKRLSTTSIRDLGGEDVDIPGVESIRELEIGVRRS